MLNSETKRKIQSARDILVGKVPDPKSQVEQITLALMFKFMDDMDKDAMALGAKAKFFSGEFAEYSWSKILDSRLGAQDRLNLYAEALGKMNQNPNIPQLFKNIFKNAFLPYRDPETLTLFLKQINEFTYSHSEQLGDAFEFLLSRMASQGDAGQFRTPRHIIDFIVAVVDPDKNQSVLDPACGTAGFLISAYKYVLEKNKEKGLTPDEKGFIAKNFVGYDISPDMVRLSLVNMYLHGFADPQIHEYDSLSSTTRWEDKYDVILANPPFMTPKGGIKPHKRFGIQAHRSEVLFVDYILEHLSIRGKAGIIVPEGIIFKSENAYKQLRKKLVEDGLYCVVSLPAGVFQPYSGVKTSILLFDNEISKHTKNMLFVKVETDGFDLGAQRRQLDDHFGDLTEAKKTILEYKDFILTGNTHNNLFLERIKNNEKIGETIGLTHDKFSIVSKEVISESGDYNLSGDRYKIQNIIPNQKWPMKELKELCSLQRGLSYSTKGLGTEEDGVPLYNLKSVKRDSTEQKNDFKYFTGEIKDKHFVSKGDILIALTDLTPSSELIGSPKLVTDNLKAAYSADLAKVNVIQDLLYLSYLYYLLRSDKYRKYIVSYSNGTNVKHLQTDGFYKFKIPLPPLEIQQQIVDELDGYQKIISGAKQVIENWKPNVEIQNGWKKTSVEEIASKEKNSIKAGPFGSSLKKECYVKKGYKIYGQEQVIRGDINYGDYFISEEKYKELESCAIKENDILISLVGTYGKMLIVPKEFIPGIINPRLMKITLDNSLCSSQYFKIIFESELIKRQLDELSYGGIMGILNTTVLRKLKIPLPSLEIQNEIVEKVEEERKLVESNKKLIEIYEQKIKSKIAEVWGEE